MKKTIKIGLVTSKGGHLAESGVISMILFLIIMGLFIQQDIRYLEGKNEGSFLV